MDRRQEGAQLDDETEPGQVQDEGGQRFAVQVVIVGENAVSYFLYVSRGTKFFFFDCLGEPDQKTHHIYRLSAIQFLIAGTQHSEARLR
jgi:hypothetical protein